MFQFLSMPKHELTCNEIWYIMIYCHLESQHDIDDSYRYPSAFCKGLANVSDYNVTKYIILQLKISMVSKHELLKLVVLVNDMRL